MKVYRLGCINHGIEGERVDAREPLMILQKIQAAMLMNFEYGMYEQLGSGEGSSEGEGEGEGEGCIPNWWSIEAPELPHMTSAPVSLEFIIQN